MSIKYADNMPSLNLRIPTNMSISENVELSGALLRQWLKQLPKHDIDAYLSEYITALQRFNTNRIGLEQRLSLLDIYRESINKLVFTYSKETIHKASLDNEQYKHLITAIAETLSQIAMGYKIIVMESLQNNDNLKLNNLALMAVNRVAEQLSYLALHAYKFYQAIPAKVLNELHQLYMLLLNGGVEDKIPKLATMPAACSSYKTRYSQLLLVCICNPYGLYSNDVIKAYQLMERFAAVVGLDELPQGAEARAGHFYINCLGDGVPLPSVLPMADGQTQPPALVLDTKPVLVKVDLLFQRVAQVDDHPDITDIELLKSLVPYLNTSYERKELRSAMDEEQTIYVAIGIGAIHQCINAINSSDAMNNIVDGEAWRLLNKTNSGYLISTQQAARLHHVYVGDLIGIFECVVSKQATVSKVGFIRWIRTDVHGVTNIGIALIEGDPVCVKIGSVDGVELETGLFLPEVARIHQAASIITSKNFAPLSSILRIKPNKKRFEFTLTVDRLLHSGNNFDHLSLKDSD